MTILLGLRMALAGGRESAARMALMAIGVAIGAFLMLLSLTGLPIMQTHIDRLAWHRTDDASPATAPDRALWVAVTDRYAGHDVIRVHVAALGPRPPVPPGIDRLPAPGEVFVSPALAALLRSTPDDQLRDRFPGRVAGTIGPDGLVMPGELVGIVGRTPEEMRATHGAIEIRGIEQPGDRLDLYSVFGVLFGLLAALIIGPVAVFVSMAARVGGPRREQRFAALRLAGATRWQTAVLASAETAGAALTGVLLGCLGFLAGRPVVASQITLGHGMPIFPQDVRAPIGSAAIALAAVLLLAVGTTLMTLPAVQARPLGVVLRGRRRPPRAWRLLPIAAGFVGVWSVAMLQRDPNYQQSPLIGFVALLAALSVLLGFFLSGAWVCHWLSRGLALVSRRATTLMVARRMAADPYSTFRSVSGAALAIYLAAGIGLTAAHDHAGAPASIPSVLDHGVVAVHVRGAPETSLAPLMRPGVVVARVTPDRQIVVACADLARVTALDCQLPAYTEGPGGNRYVALEDLFILPHPDTTGADEIFLPSGFEEPGPDADRLPIQTLFVPTDGTLAAQERIRTIAAVTVPISRSKTGDDMLGRGADLSITGLETVLPYAMVFVLLVAACSLTISVVNGMLERRRPFALLRAAGLRLGELRTIVLLEIGIPLAVSTLAGIGLAMLNMYATAPRSEWVLPSQTFFAGLGAGVLAAFAVSCIALPFMNVATRHESIRFE